MSSKIITPPESDDQTDTKELVSCYTHLSLWVYPSLFMVSRFNVTAGFSDACADAVRTITHYHILVPGLTSIL